MEDKSMDVFVKVMIAIFVIGFLVVAFVPAQEDPDAITLTVVNMYDDVETAVKYVPALSSIYMGGFRRTMSSDCFIEVVDAEGNQYTIDVGRYLYNSLDIGDQIRGRFIDGNEFHIRGYDTMDVVATEISTS